MSRLAAKLRILLDCPEDNLDGLLQLLQSRKERPRPRPWSKLPLLVEEQPEAIALFPQITTALAPLVDSKNSDLRYGALQALGMIGSPEAREVFLQALGDPLSICRVAALDGLAVCPPSPAVVDQVIALLSDEKQGVRLHAASALGRLGDDRAVPHLQALLAEGRKEPRGVRQWAAFSLSELGQDAGANPQASLAEEDPGEEEAIQREAAQRVADGIGEMLAEFKSKDRVTLGDFVSGLEQMEQQFERDALPEDAD